MGDDRPTRRQVAEDVATRAHLRDRAAHDRDERARGVDDALAVDPAAYDGKEVARLAARDRLAAEDDRRAAAGDRGELIRALLGSEPDGRGGWAPDGPVRLRPRERDVLIRIAQGMTTRQIADDLYLSVNTVKTHTRSIYRKVGVGSRVAATNWARDHGYVD